MIVLPTKGVARSISVHNSDINVLSDWIETSAICMHHPISRAEIIDTLMEEEIYVNQEFAAEIVTSAWNEIHRRSKLCRSSYSVVIDSEWIKCSYRWRDKPEHIFCLLLSLAPKYDWWTKDFGADYTEQGFLFELLTLDSLITTSNGWEVELTGWSRAHRTGLKEVAERVSQIVGDGRINMGYWNPTAGGDLGLDLLFYRPFPDHRRGFPYMLIQCASGADWEKKRGTPNLKIWRHLINPVTAPFRGFAVPFCLSDSEFWKSCVICGGMLLDRCRLLAAGNLKEEWLSKELKDGIISWIQPRIEDLLRRSE